MVILRQKDNTARMYIYRVRVNFSKKYECINTVLEMPLGRRNSGSWKWHARKYVIRAAQRNVELWIFPIARCASGLHDVVPFGLFRPVPMLSVTSLLPARAYFMEYMITQL